MLTNNLNKKWPINSECAVPEIKHLLIANATSDCFYEDFMMIDLMTGYLKRLPTIDKEELQ